MIFLKIIKKEKILIYRFDDFHIKKRFYIKKIFIKFLLEKQNSDNHIILDKFNSTFKLTIKMKF